LFVKRVFVELTGFRRELERQATAPEILREIQIAILTNTVTGDLVPGCGGVRKYGSGMRAVQKENGVGFE
jgi:hypothetical protein